MMLERQQVLEESLRRGIDGLATTDDWLTILAVCGIDHSHFFKKMTH